MEGIAQSPATLVLIGICRKMPTIPCKMIYSMLILTTFLVLPADGLLFLGPLSGPVLPALQGCSTDGRGQPPQIAFSLCSLLLEPDIMMQLNKWKPSQTMLHQRLSSYRRAVAYQEMQYRRMSEDISNAFSITKSSRKKFSSSPLMS